MALIIIIIVFSQMGDSSDSPDPVTAPDTTAVSDETAATDETVASEAPAFPGAKDSDVVGNAGDQLTLGEVIITSGPIEDGDDTLGKTLCVPVNLENTSDDTVDFNPFDWKLQFPTGTIKDSTFMGSDDLLSSGQIAPGGTATGDICFDAPDAAAEGQHIVLYEPAFSFFSDRGAWINER